MLLDKEHTEVIKCPIGKNGSVIIPEGVKSIMSQAFEDCKNLESVVLPNSITSIGDSAFSNCTNLSSINAPVNIQYVGGGALDGTAWYKNQPDGDVYFGRVYMTYKGNMPENTTVNIKDGTVSISAYALTYEDNLVGIIIPESVESIGYGVFYNCKNLKKASISEGVTTINSSAFYGCSELDNILIPDSVSYVGSGAFDRTAWYDNLPDGDVYTGKVYYRYKGEMPENTTVKIKEGTKSIVQEAFYYCTNLTKVIIPDSVKEIGYGAFWSCKNLKRVSIPEGVTTIEGSTFANCISLEKIEIPISVTAIERDAFSDCESLVDIVIPESVTEIGNGVFFNCINMKKVVIPENVMRIDPVAFGYYSLDGMNNKKTENFIILGENGSAAEKYAKDNEFMFFSISDPFRGDTNGDETADIADALMIARYDAGLITLDSAQLSVSDVNDDGDADIADALMIARYDAGLIDKL